MRAAGVGTDGHAGRRTALIVLVLLLLCAGLWIGGALAEAAGSSPSGDKPSREDTEDALLAQAGFDDLALQSEELAGVDARAVVKWALSGDIQWDESALERLAERFGSALKRALMDVLADLAVPVLSSLVLRMLLGGGGSGSLGLLCRLGCASLLTARYLSQSQIAEDMLQSAVRLMDAACPVLASVMAMTGAGGASAVLSPASAVYASVMQRALGEVALPLCGVAAIVASAANLSERFTLNRLFELLRRVISAGIRLITGAFVGILALEGLLVSGQDAAAGRVLQRAMQGALPIIGGQLSDSAGVLMGSAAALRNAVGVTGMAAVLGACAGPVLRLMAASLSLQLAAAVLEPVADPGVVRIIVHFSGLSRMLLAICAGCALLSVLILGACLGMAGA